MRITVLTGVLVFCVLASGQGEEPLELMLQQRINADSGEKSLVVQEPARWQPDETAIIVCDMWDQHWCQGATRRVAEMAPHMEKTLKAAREQGVLIIHAPSDVVDFYDGTKQRKRARKAPHAKGPDKAAREAFSKHSDPGLPIDDSDGGCDCEPQCPQGQPWTRQIDSITIAKQDVISCDGREVFNVLKQEDRKNVILMGVHTNMCVLGRPFAIKAQLRNGFNVALMRDLTDSMYNSRMAPYVNHHRGTDLVVQYIEATWCPTLTSTVFTREAPFRFKEDTRPHAVFILHEDEYDAEKTVPVFAEKELAGKRQWKCTYLMGDGLHNIPGLEVLQDADVMVVYARRQMLPPNQLGYIKAYCKSGKPVVGIRTASHAFGPRGSRIRKGHETWEAFDPEILGGNYHGHLDNKKPGDPPTLVWGVPEAKDHPILKGLNLKKRQTRSWLYEVLPLEDKATPLMMGAIEGSEDTSEPVAWTNTGKWGNRVFSTTLGHQEEFKDEEFTKLLVNGVLWAAHREN